jgi:hypothetical protein
MSNQGWSQLPRKNKTTGDKVFDAVTWPFRKVFGAVSGVVLMRHAKKRAAARDDYATPNVPDAPTAPAGPSAAPAAPAEPTPPAEPRR